jgi:hypothetical protein
MLDGPPFSHASMTQLILYRGNDTITVGSPPGDCYFYRIGAGRVEGEGLIDLNDAERLNAIVEKIRDSYTRWIYSLNASFVDAELVINNLSLFFLTDLSCKRSEFFETLDFICGLLLLRERLAGIQVDTARLIGVNPAFAQAFRSIFVDTAITIEQSAAMSAGLGRRLVADSLYLVRVVGVWAANKLGGKQPVKALKTRKMFLSFYPQMFAADDSETKYGALCDNLDRLAVTVLADGMHQRVSLKNYWIYSSQAEMKGINVIDRHLLLRDAYFGFRWAGRLWWWYRRQRKARYVFDGIDLSGLIRAELRFSISRVTRLCVFKGAVERFLKRNRVSELFYYPFEYPLGRMISWVSCSVSPQTKRTGFQMSIVSKRRLEQFLAPGEGAVHPPFIHHVPIPDRVLAEDPGSASIYRRAGYLNVSVMDKVYRYAYLDGIRSEQRPGLCLVAPGLHDGEVMLEQLGDEILTHPKQTYLLKPHPRADNRYLQQWTNLANLQISYQPVVQLLAIVSRVFVTYSSVGLEARQLGIKVTVINVPGRVNASPLLDLHG